MVFKRNEKAKEAVMNAIPFSISIVTYMELLQGMRNKTELEQMKSAFKRMKVNVLPLSERISIRAANYVENYFLSNSMEMADALIACTCLDNNTALLTANDKHYQDKETRIY